LINSMTCDLLGFARAGYASVTPYGPPGEMLFERVFVPPPRRYTSERGTFAEQIKFAAFEYKFGDQVYLLYVVDCRDGVMAYPAVKGYFLLSDKVEGQSGGEDIDRMIEAATKWALALHDEVWVFDQGYWHKDTELFKAVGKSSWEDVILDDEKKQEIIHDVSSFFAGEESYNEFAVPWKVCLFQYIYSSPPRLIFIPIPFLHKKGGKGKK
jgi:transitional endoplasmic reticulum ATPase